MKVTLNSFFVISTSVLVILLCCSTELYSQPKKSGVRKVVIDPGHGGKHPGTVYKQYLEKDITLKVALLLGSMIEKNLPDVTVVYTRTKDEYVDLVDRGNIANKAGADLFISIHVDAVKSPSANGSSTFVMGMDKSNANLDVAMRENDVVSYEEDYSTKYEGYIPGSTESFIIFSLMQYVYLDQSMSFANMIQKNYLKNTPIVDRGARQAPYLVLWKTAMPSVLTEIGFLSNEHDRRFLTTDSGQQKIARSLFNAFSEYKSKVDGNSKAVYLDDSYIVASDSDSSKNANTSNPASATSGSVASDSGAATTARSVYIDSDRPSVFFSVQVCSSTSKISSNSATFKEYRGQVTERKVGKLYKYYIGECKSYREALTLQTKVRRSIKDAFIVGIKDGVPIPQAEARKLIN